MTSHNTVIVMIDHAHVMGRGSGTFFLKITKKQMF